MKTLEDVLEEITPQPDPEFVADMERRMQQLGDSPLSRTQHARRRLPALRARKGTVPVRPRVVAAVAASAMLAVLVSVSLLSGGEEVATNPGGAIALEEPTTMSTDNAQRRLAAPDSSGGGEFRLRAPD